MESHYFVGYSPKLYEALQISAYQEFQYEPTDDVLQTHNCHPVDYREHITLCLRALMGVGSAVDEVMTGYGLDYFSNLYDQCDDDMLYSLLKSGKLSSLKFDEDGYYVAELPGEVEDVPRLSKRPTENYLAEMRAEMFVPSRPDL